MFLKLHQAQKDKPEKEHKSWLGQQDLTGDVWNTEGRAVW